MGIQIKGSNDTISASDGSMVLEGSALTFDNESITGISTMATGHITGTATIDDDLKVGISTLFVDVSTGRVGINTISPQSVLQVNDNNPVIAQIWRKNGGTDDQARIALGALSTNVPTQRGITLVAENNGAGHDFIVNTSPSHGLGPTEKLRVKSSGQVLIGTETEGQGDADDLTINTSGDTGITIRSGSSEYGNIFFSDATSGTAEYVGAVQYYHADNTLRLKTNSNDRLILNKEGDVNITGVTTATGFYPTTAQTGRRNMAINGNMSIAQRATSSTSGGYQTIDRFYTHWSGGSGTISQQSLANGDEIEGSTHYLRMAVSSASDYTVMRFPLEDVRRFSGDITVSFYAKYVTNAPNGGLTLWWQTNYGSGGTAGGQTAMQVFNGSGLPSLTTSWAKYSLTFSDFPSLSGKTIGANNFAELLFGQGTNSGGTAWTLDITNIQVEKGKSASAFEQISQQENLALCRRYFQKIIGDSDEYTGLSGYSETTSNARFPIYFRPPMRSTPTMAINGTFRFQGGTNDSATFTSGLVLQNVNNTFDGAAIQVTGTSGMGAADRPGNLQFKASGSYLSFDAELPI